MRVLRRNGRVSGCVYDVGPVLTTMDRGGRASCYASHCTEYSLRARFCPPLQLEDRTDDVSNSVNYSVNGIEGRDGAEVGDSKILKSVQKFRILGDSFDYASGDGEYEEIEHSE